ncbi:hypothetical protein Pyn_23454 [Prunus yedoensis var. nudiflora]|uniref:Rab-GAP TBC domain-containing protein n=1 Tax=Prunus yedoensis var. nudiflora TaxID=2094558 RepID=A0A314U7B5_PRUYE|nr:hypothetical protein Pyn_23454 [Prunus yedoensis var. nudiflora]
MQQKRFNLCVKWRRRSSSSTLSLFQRSHAILRSLSSSVIWISGFGYLSFLLFSHCVMVVVEVEAERTSNGVVGNLVPLVNLQRVGSIVRDISDPCLSQSPIKVNKMLKPEKWQATFDSDGKNFCFPKALKLIVLGGVDQSIRPEVWEFLLGCYALGSTAESRRQLRTARRERYRDLIKQCQMMHSSIGTGSLAYVVGSKVMDVRAPSKDDEGGEAKVEHRQTSFDNTNKVENYCDRNNNCTDTSYACQQESSSESVDLVSVRESTDSAAYDSSCFIHTSSPHDCSSPKLGREADGTKYVPKSYFEYPTLPVTDLFEKCEEDDEGCVSDDKLSAQYVPDTEFRNTTMSQGGTVSEDRVSEWLWTLHRIVVDVVRTDSHLEFYEDAKNLARMSDILAVYAWVDPATDIVKIQNYHSISKAAEVSFSLTDYCFLGMSDLLSPFVVLFEDNADAFWCFEMLLRRMRENFQMEGPTGVMKQLQALWNILELTDREMFAHLSHIGAESLHFAFRMLLVLFRRELSFDDALCMWEMMWAADFQESLAYNLEDSCLEALVVQLPRDLEAEMRGESVEGGGDMKGGSHSNNGNPEHSMSDTGMKSASTYHFCGLTRNFWSKNDRMHICTAVSSTRNGDDELPVFCVAAILIMNRQKIIRETRSIDDMIKIFNDNLLKISVKRCIRTAVKLRKKYFYKLIKKNSPSARNGD